MPDKQVDTFHFPILRWLLIGLGAVVAVAGLILLFAWLAHDEVPESEVPEQVVWSIVLVDQTGDTVTLKGDLPAGVTTETWQNDFQVTRSSTGTFEWDMTRRLPVAVADIDDATGCDALNAELDDWVAAVGAAEGDAVNLQARAFAQHALDRMRSEGCEIDEEALQDAVG